MTQLDDLLGALLAVPRLDGARCVGRSDIWDETDDPYTIDYAVSECLRCEALQHCREYFDSLTPRRKPTGVVAAKLKREAPRRKAAS